MQEPAFFYDGPCWDESGVLRFDDLPVTREGKSQALMWSGDPEVFFFIVFSFSSSTRFMSRSSPCCAQAVCA